MHRPKILAFYLPQFHPIPENDEWWEPGFTEWTNVARAQPLFPGHYQPHLPGELGYYDLRVPEVRAQQADLARHFGIHGFVYYHYWFLGRRLLERPFDEVLASGQPDFPFALCWANEEWTRNWDALSGTVLVEQHYSEEDDLAHIRWLVRAFADDRYIKIDGRPLMLVYRSDLLPGPERTTELWRAETRAAGFPDIYLAMIESRLKRQDPRPLGFDASVGFRSDAYQRLTAPVEAFRTNVVLDYDAAVDAALHRPPDPWKRFPGVMAGWDNTARRRHGATIYSGGTPEAYERWLRGTIASVADVRDEENYIFVAAWNEWAEGNHLEPDQRYGRQYLEATSRALRAAEDPAGPPVDSPDGPGAPGALPGQPVQDPDSPAGHVLRLVRAASLDVRHLVELGAEHAALASAATDAGIAYQSIPLGAGAGWVESVVGRLETSPRPGTLVLRGVLERVPDPHLLLSALSTWSNANGSVPMVISVANVARFDAGVRLLAGQWDPTDADAQEGTVVRQFTRAVLARLVEGCGWAVVGTDDVHSDLSVPDSTGDGIPEAMAGALRVMAESSNPDWSVERFVWVLAPSGIEQPPLSYAGAVARSAAAESGPGDPSALSRYFSSLGLLAGETQVRVEERLRRTRARKVRQSVQHAVSELVFPDRYVDLPLLSDVVDDLAEFYLARSDLGDAFGAEESFDAMSYVQWAMADQPMVAASVHRLGQPVRDAAAEAIRRALSASGADRTEREGAAEVLADLYFHRWDLRSAMGNGSHLEVESLLRWAVAASRSDDSSAARLAPYRSTFESALAATPESGRPTPPDPPSARPAQG